MRHHYREFIIMSAERENIAEHNNDIRTERLENILVELGINFKPIKGVYKDTKEFSFMCFLEPVKGFDVEFFERLAKNFDQECILYRDKYNKCYLHYNSPDGKTSWTEKLDGSFKQVSQSDVENLDAYSIIGGKFYAVR